MTAVTKSSTGPSLRSRFQDWLPRLVLAPSFLLVLVFVYGFNLWTLFLSFTNSKAFPTTNLIGFTNYLRLWNWTFETDPPSNWYTALINMGLFGGLYIFLPFPWSRAGNPARPEDPRGRNSAANLSLPPRAVFHSDRDGLEIVSRPGHRPRKGDARLGLGELSF
jgi:hypothetical protein